MARYRHYTHPVTHSRVKRRTHKHKGLGDLGADYSIVQRGLTASMDAVKSVGMVALVAAGGAIATDYVFKDLLKSTTAGKDIIGFTNGSWEQNVAKAVFGIAGGLVIGKFAKKPQLGAAFAIGAVALAVYNIINKEVLKTVSGLGYISAERQRAFYPRPLSLGAQRTENAMTFKPMPAPAVAGYGSY